MQALEVGDFYFTFDVNLVEVNRYVNKYYHGITFIDLQGKKYDIVCNPHLGNRLIRVDRNYASSDIPFKESTFGFLPEGVSVRLKR